jgi:hypothetical protein
MSNRPRRTCHAWQSLFWGLLFFAGLQIGLGLSLDQGLLRVRDPEYAAKEKQLRARRAEAPTAPLVVMLGSSRTLLGFDARKLDDDCPAPRPVVFNLGLIGGGPVLEGLCLKRLLAAGLRPDLLLVEVLPPSLNQAGNRALEEDWLSGTRLSGAELLASWPYHNEPSHLLEQWTEARAFPWWRHHKALGGCLALDAFRIPASPPWGAIDGHGWHAHPLPGFTPAQRRQATDFAHWQYRHAFGDFHLATRPTRALNDLLDRCRQEHIPVALVLMPENTEFRAFYPPAMRQGIDAYLANLSNARQVPLIDARNWIEDTGFWDGHHLLPEGAAAFSTQLGRAVIGPMLRR